MSGLRVEVITPEKTALNIPADFVVLPAVGGEMGILPGHEPFLVQLSGGEVRVTSEGETRAYAVAGGFAEILKDKISVFAETADLASEIDAEAARQELERAKVQSTRRDLDPMTLAAAEAAMRLAAVKLRVSEARKRRGGPAPKRG